jgi:3-phenylpropionate/cinnamic acid dioxygenase small subunit
VTPPLAALRQEWAAELELDRLMTRFLVQEAGLLDDRRYDEWLDLLTEDFHYRLPVPLVREDPWLPRYDDRAVLFEATKTGLAFKAGRMGERAAWSDRPHNFQRRFVSNVRAEPGDGGAGVVRVRSNVLMAVAPPGEPPVFVTAGRADSVVLDGTRPKLAGRTVYLDAEVPTHLQISAIF